MNKTEGFHPSNILCPVDFSELSDLALKYAAVGAKVFGATLVVFHAQRFELPPYFTSSQIAGLRRQRGEEKAKAKEYLRLHIKNILGPAAESIRTKYDVEDAHPVDAILAAAKRHQTDLIVMGTHGRGGAKRLWLGSVLENVVRQAGVPVFAVRQKQHEFIDASDPQKMPELKTILCPVNFTEAARAGLEHAVSLSRQFSARLVAACINEPRLFSSTSQAKGKLASWLKETQAAECAVQVRAGKATAGKQIVELASQLKSDLVVLGAQPQNAFHNWIWGDTTEYVLRQAPVPVLIVPR